MIVQEADLLKDLSHGVHKKIADIMVEESHEKGSTVFTAGDPAKNLYLIVEGRVRLSIGTGAEIDYTASAPGEAFGWTGMVGRATHVATATCSTPCTLVKIDVESLGHILERDSAEGMLFYKRLSAAVVQRLVDNYGMFLSEGSLRGVTYGSGQVMGSEE